METLHDIISIEKVYLDKDGDIVVEAILENMGSETHPQTLYDMPEYAPALCKTTIYKEGVPPGITLEDKFWKELSIVTTCWFTKRGSR